MDFHIQFSTDRHLSWVQILAAVNAAAVITEVQTVVRLLTHMVIPREFSTFS